MEHVQVIPHRWTKKDGFSPELILSPSPSRAWALTTEDRAEPELSPAALPAGDGGGEAPE